MDVGVGGIVVASGLAAGASSALRGGPDIGIPGAGAGVAIADEGRKWYQGVRKALPCILLGGARFASVKLLGYQVSYLDDVT